MKTVFVSGCYDIIHGGHIQFFKDAKALGDKLVVCVASESDISLYKHRKPSTPDSHKIAVLSSIKFIDEVYVGNSLEWGLNFKDVFLRVRPDILAVTEDDKFELIKRDLCKETGTQYVVLPKTVVENPLSTSDIVRRLNVPEEVNLRVDFAGGWLDVPRFSKFGAFVVNCTIDKKLSLRNNNILPGSGIGGSAAIAILHGKEPFQSEYDQNCGWQDPAIILETGLCVWRSGVKPVLEAKFNPDFLFGKMALYWTKRTHDTAYISKQGKPFEMIEFAGHLGAKAAYSKDFDGICKAVNTSYAAQLEEGMVVLPSFGEKAKKYCGSGYGGYALYLFNSNTNLPAENKLESIEPFVRSF